MAKNNIKVEKNRKMRYNRIEWDKNQQKRVINVTKKVINLVIVMIILCMSINMCSYEVCAALPSERGTDSRSEESTLEINPGAYDPGSKDDASGATRLKNMGNTIIGFIQIVASVLSVIILMVMGIKYMMGSVEEKAEYKKAMLPYVIGIVIVFSITTILGIIANISKNLLL